MGYAIARAAVRRGADVTLISGPVSLECPEGVERINVISASDMADAVIRNAKSSDIVIKAAAVADYRPTVIADEKIKKHDGDDMSIALERTQDILGYLGKHKREGQFLCGFSMETQNMIENTRKKLESKCVDLMVANNVKQEGAGFAVDTNVVTLITKDDLIELPIMSKEEVADKLLDEILKRR